jgi:hypothetical protein
VTELSSPTGTNLVRPGIRQPERKMEAAFRYQRYPIIRIITLTTSEEYSKPLSPANYTTPLVIIAFKFQTVPAGGLCSTTDGKMKNSGDCLRDDIRSIFSAILQNCDPCIYSLSSIKYLNINLKGHHLICFDALIIINKNH